MGASGRWTQPVAPAVCTHPSHALPPNHSYVISCYLKRANVCGRGTSDLCVAGDIRIHIDRTFGLDEVSDALPYVGDGLARGKVVVTTD